MTASLDTAAASLAAGRDLLRTHLFTGADGTPLNRSDWAPVVTSAPVTMALLKEIASWCQQLALLTGRLSVTLTTEPASVIPVHSVHRGLASACHWLVIADATIRSGQRTVPATLPGTGLLMAVPARAVPERRPLRTPEATLELCLGAVTSAVRLRAIAYAAAVTDKQVAAVLAAVHYATDTLARVAAADTDTVGTAIRARRLYAPTRTLPEDVDVPYRYGPASTAETVALLKAYKAATDATTLAAAGLDTVAVSLNASSQVLAAARAAVGQGPVPHTDHETGLLAGDRQPAGPGAMPSPGKDPPPTRPPGPVEQAIRDVSTTRTPAVAGSTDTPEFAVTDAEGKLIATFTIAADGQVTSDNEVVADMVTSMIKTRRWTAAEAGAAFSEGWSNAYVSITSRPR